MSISRNLVGGLAVTAIALALVAPTALSALSGSGNVTDIVQLNVATSSLGALSSTAAGGSASGSPVTSGANAFTLDNSGSNVDTFVRYDWGASPYYGGVAGQTGITLRGTTHVISDLLWFRQITTLAAGTTSSEYFAPLVLKSGVARATFVPGGNACTGWAGSATGGFSASSAGSFTFRYYEASSQTDDAPLTSDTFHYCLDAANSLAYIGESASFTTATLVYSYGGDSANGALKNYQYEFLNGAQTEGNTYCLTGITGSGTNAMPNLAQCQKLPFELTGATTVKMGVLFDPPAYFPSVNQGGALTYGLSGTQWNPYASSTTNSA